MANSNESMREALEHVEKLAREFAAGNYYVSDFPKMLLDAIRPALALSAPPRNCDVGTAEEQSRRLAGFCKSHGLVDGISRCEKCRFLGDDNCELVWAQMPYTEGGAS